MRVTLQFDKTDIHRLIVQEVCKLYPTKNAVLEIDDIGLKCNIYVEVVDTKTTGLEE